MPLEQLQRLTENDMAIAFQQIDALPNISAASKQELKNLMRAGNNPKSSELETIIKTLPKERQAQIRLIFEQVAARQQQQADEAAKALLLLGLLTLGSLLTAWLVSVDEEALQAAQLLEIMKRAYVQGVQDEIDYCGCNAIARQPSGEQLAHLEAMARADAQSIIATWNKDAKREIEKLYKDNPDGSKAFFLENMKAWAEKRLIWKSLSIAFNTETQAREYGRSQFAVHNYAETTKFLFKGSYPACDDCLYLWGLGAVDFAYTQRFPNPQHPNCDHYWKPQRKPTVNCASLWVG